MLKFSHRIKDIQIDIFPLSQMLHFYKFTHLDRYEILRTKLSIYSIVFNSKTPETCQRPPIGAWFPRLGQLTEDRAGHTATLRGRETICVLIGKSLQHTHKVKQYTNTCLYSLVHAQEISP